MRRTPAHGSSVRSHAAVLVAAVSVACGGAPEPAPMEPVVVPAPQATAPAWGEAVEIAAVRGVPVEGPLDCTSEGVCWLHPRPRPLRLHVAGTGPGAVFLFGEQIRRFDGRGWHRLEGCPVAVDAMWAGAADDVFFADLLGEDDDGYRPATICHYDGVALTTMTLPADAPLVALWGTGSSDVWAVGGSDHAEEEDDDGPWLVAWHYDGARWRAVTLPARTRGLQVVDVWGASGDVMLMTDAGDLLRWDGRRMRLVARESESDPIVDARAASRPTLDEQRQSRWASAPDDVYEIDARGAARHFDGTTWTPVAGVEALFGGEVRALSAASTSDVAILGHDAGGSWLGRFDGARWTRYELGAGTEARALVRLGDGSLVAVGDGLWRVDGERWQHDAGPTGITDAWPSGGALHALDADGVVRLSPGGAVERVAPAPGMHHGCETRDGRTHLVGRRGEAAGTVVTLTGADAVEDASPAALRRIFCVGDDRYRIGARGLELAGVDAWRSVDLGLPRGARAPRDFSSLGSADLVVAGDFGVVRITDGVRSQLAIGAIDRVALAADGTLVAARGGSTIALYVVPASREPPHDR